MVSREFLGIKPRFLYDLLLEYTARSQKCVSLEVLMAIVSHMNVTQVEWHGRKKVKNKILSLAEHTIQSYAASYC